MRTRLPAAIGAVLVGSAVVWLAACSQNGEPPPTVPAAAVPTTVTTAIDTTAPTVTRTTPTTTTTLPAEETFLVWVSGGLTPDFVAGLEDAFAAVSVVMGDSVELAVPDGAVPLDALALDPDDHRPFDPEGRLGPLAPGQVVLGESSADLRQAGRGDALELDGISFRVAAVVPDDLVAAAEVAFDRDDPAQPLTTDRFALVHTAEGKAAVEEAALRLNGGPDRLRVRAAGEVPWLRHADSVLPQIFMKQDLGEFSYTALSGGEFDQDATFLTERIVTADVPILGSVKCHETVADMLVGAMTQLEAEGLANLVDPPGFAGCWYPRFVRSVTGSPAGVSRHAWGAAVDINAPANPFGSAGTQDPRLVETMRAWGFTWGGDWALPDPMHFEYMRP